MTIIMVYFLHDFKNDVNNNTNNNISSLSLKISYKLGNAFDVPVQVLIYLFIEIASGVDFIISILQMKEQVCLYPKLKLFPITL